MSRQYRLAGQSNGSPTMGIRLSGPPPNSAVPIRSSLKRDAQRLGNCLSNDFAALLLPDIEILKSRDVGVV